jgi:hypothetical protein
VTVESTDTCGNLGSASFQVNVSGFFILVDIQLGGAGYPLLLTRCITFELFDCPGDATEVSHEVTFTNGLATQVAVPVPCGTYSCITARDELHTLRRTTELSIDGGQYTANFTGNPNSGGDWLVGGNLDDDDFIDILDFAIYINSFGFDFGTGNTTCSTVPYHADISGNGTIGTEDFTFVQVGFFQGHEANCCETPNLGGGKSSITCAELRRRGLGSLVIADLNSDAVVDQRDIVAFLDGARPVRPVKSTQLLPGIPSPTPKEGIP